MANKITTEQTESYLETLKYVLGSIHTKNSIGFLKCPLICVTKFVGTMKTRSDYFLTNFLT